MAKNQEDRAQLLGHGSSDDEDFEVEIAPKDNLSKLKGQVNEVKDVMRNNIEKVIERGSKIDLIQDKTDDLSENALRFKHKSKQLRRKMWWQNMRFNIMIGCICFVILAVVIIAVILSMKD